MKITIDEYCNNNIIPFRYIKFYIATRCKIIIYNDDEPSFILMSRLTQNHNAKIFSTIEKGITALFSRASNRVCHPHYYYTKLPNRLNKKKCRHSKLKAANNIRPYTIAELSEV